MTIRSSVLVRSAFRLSSLVAAGAIASVVACGQEQPASTSKETEVESASAALSTTRHRDVTKAGLGAWVPDPATLQRFVNVSTIGDDGWASTRSEFHFDNCYWTEGLNVVRDKRNEAVGKAIEWWTKGRSETARNGFFDALGYVLHATQDFYAHSNWVETHKPGVIHPFTEGSSPPPGWYSGTYANKNDTDPDKGELHCVQQGVPRRDHSILNKDNPGSLLADEAFIDAVAASSDQMRQLAEALKEKRSTDYRSILYNLGIREWPSVTTTRWDHRRTVEVSGGPWGQEGPSLYCPEGSYVGAFRQRVELPQGGYDDTALNAIQFYCYTREGSPVGLLDPWNGVWGDWGSWAVCPRGRLVQGGILKVEAYKGGGLDDSSANAAAFYCDPGYLLANNDGQLGYWLEWAMCPIGEAVCGAQAIVEAPQHGGDDTALNRIRLHCCGL